MKNYTISFGYAISDPYNIIISVIKEAANPFEALELVVKEYQIPLGNIVSVDEIATIKQHP
jgi:hypothetical protein